MKMRVCVWVWVILISPISAWTQFADISTYSVEDGLGQSQVYTMAVDNRGLMWLGTRGGGLSRFDGSNFVTYNTRDGLVGNYLNQVHVSQDGTLWIGATQGFGCFDGRQFQNYLLDNEEEIQVFDFCELSPEQMLIGTDKGIFVMPQGDSKVRYEPSPSRLAIDISYVTRLHRGPSGGLFIGYAGGMMYLEHLADDPQSVEGLPESAVMSITTHVADSAIWVGTEGRGVYRIAKGGLKAEKINLGPEFGRLLVFDILPDTLGGTWLATLNHGALYLDSSLQIVQQLKEQDERGLPTNHVRKLWQDPWGNLWLGTSGGGLCKFSGQAFKHFGEESTLEGQAVYALAQDGDCNIWGSVGSHGFFRFNQGTFNTFDGKTGFIDAKVKALTVDQNDRIWVGTEGNGAFIFAQDTLWLSLKDSGLVRSSWIRDFAEDPFGRMWIASAGGGVNCLTPSAIDTLPPFTSQTFGLAQGLMSNRVNCLIATQDRIWCGLNRAGVAWIGPDSLAHMVDLSPLSGRINVRCMQLDERNQLWIGTSNGLIRYQIESGPEELSVVHYEAGLSSTNIYLLQFDEYGDLWIGTERGLDRATLNIDGNIVDWKHFGYPEGFIGIETCQDASIMDRDGTLWFGTINGLTHYNPQQQTSNPLPPTLSITGVDLNYSPLAQSRFASSVGAWMQIIKPIKLPWNRNHLNFNFKGINYQNPSQVRYQWKLEGLEEEWTPPETQERASYPNLSPGNYTFRVRAVNEDNVWSAAEQIAIQIKPPFWQQAWFYLVCSLAIIGIVVLVFRLRLNQVRRRSAAAQERLKMQNALLELEQKALLLQMNPHFIFHALNSIQSLIQKKEAQQARYMLAKFGKLMRRVLENSRKNSITLQTELETLEHYLVLEAFCREPSFTYELTYEEELFPEEMLIPPMILQPFIENAIIWGVGNLPTGGHISITFALGEDERHIVATITDNGVGRAFAAELKHQQQPDKTSTALHVTQERLQLLQTSESQPAILFEDLYDSSGQAQGTKVVVSLPLIEGA